MAYFEERLRIHTAEAPGRLREVFDAACQRFEFMCATLEAENAYNIFKSLNSTGVPLGQSDLVRNFVFMHVPPDEHDEFDRQLWDPLEERFARADGTLDDERFSRFLRDFLMADGRYVSPRDTFGSFEERYEATGFAPQTLARTLNECVDHYTVISGSKADASDRVTRALASLNVLESLGKEGSHPGETLESYLLERGWPDDHKFETAFVEFPLYERGYKREVLEALERARAHKEPADLERAQVEHVLPQTLSDAWVEALGPEAERIHADWLHRPGNLTLSAYNQELWNHPFGKKRERYSQSNVVITRELGEQVRWGEAEIRARGQRLAREAAHIWIGPKEQVARPPIDDDGHDDSPGRRELRMRFWSGLKDYLVAEYPELPQLEARPSWRIRVPSGLRHIGFDLRFGLRHQNVGIDVWFWREASLTVWERIRSHPDEYDALVSASWQFERAAGQPRACMSVGQVAAVRDESSWPELYRWLGEKLSFVYERVAPRLRREMDGRST